MRVLVPIRLLQVTHVSEPALFPNRLILEHVWRVVVCDAADSIVSSRE